MILCDLECCGTCVWLSGCSSREQEEKERTDAYTGG